MARTYRLTPGTRLVNWMFAIMTRAGAGAPYRHILTVRGRKSGRLHSTPVDVVEATGHRWLVGGYGPSSWTLNAPGGRRGDAEARPDRAAVHGHRTGTR